MIKVLTQPALSRFSGARAVGRAAVGPPGGARGRVGHARVQGEAGQPGAASHVEEEGERELQGEPTRCRPNIPAADMREIENLIFW